MTGILKSWSLQLHNDTKMSSQLNSLFFIVTSIVYGDKRQHWCHMLGLDSLFFFFFFSSIVRLQKKR
jgi:hypothetical protein